VEVGGCGGHLGLTEARLQVTGEDYITTGFIICTANEILFGWSNKKE